MRFYRHFSHSLLGLLLSYLDRILGYIYSHSVIWQVKFFTIKIDFYFPTTAIKFLSCFFAFHIFLFYAACCIG